MKLNYIKRITFLSLLLVLTCTYAQVPTIQWQKSLGGTGNEYAKSIDKTTDGGYIIVGNSDMNNGDVTGNHGNNDYWVVKLTSAGLIQWQKSLGGTLNDEATSVKQTVDGGYIIAGYSTSNNGDVTGNHGVNDYWIVKLTSTGSIQWQKTLGGTGQEYANSINLTTDGGYIVAGRSKSNNGDVTGNHGNDDYWVVKLTSTGIIQWQKSLGGSSGDSAQSISQTSDGGYIVAGISLSNNGDVTGNHGGDDYWVVKLNSVGTIEWQKSLGGSSNETANSIIQTSDNGFIISGYSESNNGDVTGNHGLNDYWIVKLTSAGLIQWQKSLGGSSNDDANNIKQTTDGGYIIVGYSDTYNNGDVTGNHSGDNDYWVVKLNSTGILLWQKSLGGTNNDEGLSIVQSTDGGYVIAGFALSNNDGDVSGNHGNNDYWVVKLTADTLSDNSFTENNSLSIYPNPTKENITLKLNYFSPNQEIIITDILGKTIHNQKLEGLTTTINTSNLASGIYFLNLSEGSNKIVKKFIKE